MAYSLRTDKSWAETERDLRECFRKWGVLQYEILSSSRGVQASRQHQTRDEAEVAINFAHPGSGVTMPVTSRSQDRAVDNFRVCYLALDAIRLNEARGIADVIREAYLALPAPKTERDPWEVLELRPGASAEMIESAYRTLAKKRHPDSGGSDEAFTELNAAYERLRSGK